MTLSTYFLLTSIVGFPAIFFWIVNVLEDVSKKEELKNYHIIVSIFLFLLFPLTSLFIMSIAFLIKILDFIIDKFDLTFKDSKLQKWLLKNTFKDTK